MAVNVSKTVAFFNQCLCCHNVINISSLGSVTIDVGLFKEKAVGKLASFILIGLTTFDFVVYF